MYYVHNGNKTKQEVMNEWILQNLIRKRIIWDISVHIKYLSLVLYVLANPEYQSSCQCPHSFCLSMGKKNKGRKSLDCKHFWKHWDNHVRCNYLLMVTVNAKKHSTHTSNNGAAFNSSHQLALKLESTGTGVNCVNPPSNFLLERRILRPKMWQLGLN